MPLAIFHYFQYIYNFLKNSFLTYKPKDWKNILSQLNLSEIYKTLLTTNTYL